MKQSDVDGNEAKGGLRHVVNDFRHSFSPMKVDLVDLKPRGTLCCKVGANRVTLIFPWNGNVIFVLTDMVFKTERDCQKSH
ncbi:hypothetical protein HYFRA_00008110 [Hymenoscyphus fraxineus]|uniref:Uncharacterized protein n=1 Tax=Hymenoscyphus fraxineus TaxID=746836 RepID=A0A9N9L9A3_9HELO|nr:hypothetical protein HYFRA_00008110 [Hymenoscyphus fraxineus]